jgi:hypothetical protein
MRLDNDFDRRDAGAASAWRRGLSNTAAQAALDLREQAMKFSKIAVAGAIAVAAAAAHAGPTEMDLAGPGSYTFSGFNTHSFYIDLDAGTYSFSSTITTTGTTSLSDAWFSESKDKKDKGPFDVAFNQVGTSSWSGADTLTLTAPARIFVDVKAITTGHKRSSGYDGTLTVSAVPEPATGALLLAGLGMIGVVGRRRKNG